MNRTKKQLIWFMCVALMLPTLSLTPAVWAKGRKPRQAATRDVTVIINEQQVRFTALRAAEEMRLQVFDQAGALVFDSEPVPAAEIVWPFQNAGGEAVKSGLYAYVLSVKEAGAEVARVRRGHFIVDRAADRDGADKLWVTSQGEDGVGTELTVARGEESTVAGTSAVKKAGAEQESNVTADEIPDGQVVKGVNGLTDHVTLEAGTNVAITPNGNTLTIDAQIADGQVVKGVNGLTDQVTLEAGPNITITPNGNTLTIAGTGTGGGYSSITELDGNIGIGTVIPSSKLTVQTPTASYGLSHTDGNVNLASWVGLGGSGANGAWLGTRSNHDLHFFTADSPARMTITRVGAVGISTGDPQNLLHVGPGRSSIAAGRVNAVVASNNPDAGIAIAQNSGVNVLLQASGAGGYIGTTSNHPLVLRTNDQDTVVINGFATTIRAADLLLGHASRRGTPGRALVDFGSELVVNFGKDWAKTTIGSDLGVIGRTTTQVLQITGGADFAENFDVNVGETAGEAVTAKVEAGMVVSIDQANPGKLVLSTQAYDSQVAGIISGAGGVRPGMMMSQEGTLADGQHPVALSGRVYCWVDASHGPVKPGDLLTTSATPGHAMKATDREKAQGAIIGKAMTGLKGGKGLVLVLVTLQ